MNLILRLTVIEPFGYQLLLINVPGSMKLIQGMMKLIQVQRKNLGRLAKVFLYMH